MSEFAWIVAAAFAGAFCGTFAAIMIIYHRLERGLAKLPPVEPEV